MLPALERLVLAEPPGLAGPDGVPRLAEGLVAGALPAVTVLIIGGMHMGDARVTQAPRRSPPPWTEPRRPTAARAPRSGQHRHGDAALAALAPALRRRPALKKLNLCDNPFGDEGLAALMPPPPPAGTPPPPAGGLMQLKKLDLEGTQVSDAGCAALAAALDRGALPALDELVLDGIAASGAAIDAASEALAWG